MKKDYIAECNNEFNDVEEIISESNHRMINKNEIMANELDGKKFKVMSQKKGIKSPITYMKIEFDKNSNILFSYYDVVGVEMNSPYFMGELEYFESTDEAVFYIISDTINRALRFAVSIKSGSFTKSDAEKVVKYGLDIKEVKTDGKK